MMKLEEFLEKLKVEPVDNQSIVDSMAAGVDSISLCGALPGSESLINEKFISCMPKANQAAELEIAQNTVTFDIPNMEM